MLQATVLGQGASTAYILHARKSPLLEPEPSSAPDATSSVKSPPPSIRHQSAAAPSLDPGASSVYQAADEAITWSGRSVTWSRGIEIVRRFTYAEEDVAHAGFLWFRIPGKDAFDSSSDIPGGPTTRFLGASAAGRTPNGSAHPSFASSDTNGETFGPFHVSQHGVWYSARKAALAAGTAGGDNKDLQRALVVFLETRGYAYFASGRVFIFPFPFTVDRCWALADGGCIVQRRLDKRDLKRRFARSHPPRPRRMSAISAPDRTGVSVLDDLVELEDVSGGELPLLYTFTKLFDEPKVIIEAPVQGGLGSNPSPPHIREGAPTLQFPPSQSVIHVSPDPYPFVVAWDHSEGRIVFYRRARVPLPSEPLVAPNVRTMKPEELLRQPVELNHARRSSGRASLGRQMADRRVSGTGTDILDRNRRRVSRLSTTNELEGDSREELPDAFSGSHRKPRQSSFGADNARRVSSSMMREDPRNPGRFGILQVVAQDFRDTTMMMGLDRTHEVRSDVVLDRLWTWYPPG